MKKIVALVLIILIAGIFILFEANKQPNSSTEVALGETVESGGWSVCVNDAYIPSIDMPDDIAYNFDKYVSVDITVTNITDETRTFNAYLSFDISDRNKVPTNPTFSNYGMTYKFSVGAGESYNFSLTFPVQNSEYYTLSYNSGFSQQKTNIFYWNLPDDSLQTQDQATGDNSTTENGGQ